MSAASEKTFSDYTAAVQALSPLRRARLELDAAYAASGWTDQAIRRARDEAVSVESAAAIEVAAADAAHKAALAPIHTASRAQQRRNDR